MDLNKFIEDVKDLKVLVVGESITDVYQYGITLGKSGKFPIVAFQNGPIERYSGGVNAITHHLEDFCNVTRSTDYHTIVKKRYIENGQKLFETYDIEETEWGYPITNYEDYDLVIVADFGHGFITKIMREDIQKRAKWISLNTQYNAGNKGMNTINKYYKYNYVCIDHDELRLSVSNQYDKIEDIIKDRFYNKGCTVSITMSNEGSFTYKNNKLYYSKALAHNVVDTVGAGDAFLAFTSLASYLDYSAKNIGKIGNITGAIACGYQGNKFNITKQRLLEYEKYR